MIQTYLYNLFLNTVMKKKIILVTELEKNKPTITIYTVKKLLSYVYLDV